MAPHTIVLVDAVIFFFSQFSSRQPGYKQMKVLRQERNTVCFIEFEVTSYTMTMMLFYFQASWSMLEMSSSEATKQLK